MPLNRHKGRPFLFEVTGAEHAQHRYFRSSVNGLRIDNEMQIMIYET